MKLSLPARLRPMQEQMDSDFKHIMWQDTIYAIVGEPSEMLVRFVAIVIN
jgi:hypothetical protein